MKFMAAEARCVPAPRFAMLVADGDAAIIEPDDTAFGDGDAEHISREIAQDGLGAIAPGRAMDDPGLPPCRLGQHEIGPALGQCVSHLGSHQDRERLCRHQELAARRMPVATVIGYAATGNEAVYMRMVDELLRPGVQHGKHADGAPDVTAIACQFDDGLGRRLHECGVAVPLIGAQYIAQLRFLQE